MTDDPDRWSRIEALFEAALERPRAERAAFLAREAEGDADLRAEVEALLEAHVEAGAFFERAAREIAPPGGVEAGERIGAYRVTGVLGEGGMGTVYRAERADGAFERTVALKVLRAGRGDVRRFFAERRALARLDHPGIARLYGGGVAPDGRPYFVMERVEGEPLTAYAARRGLGLEARLALFGQVCDAVAYAHRSLVVHRDLKPSNVFVTETAEGPRVKLLDFGIAKLLDEAEAELTLSGVAPRTPAYAAPEQVRGEPVTTATDVYALGVLLYELLTGRRPYRLEARARAAMERAVLETEPTRPSAAVTETTDAEASTLPAPPDRLARRLSGDLDHIVLKALRKEPDGRYGTAEAFGRDVARHLGGQTVEARPPSALYRARRFVRRHRAGVAASAVALLAVLVGAGVAVWQAAEADRQRDRAEVEARTAAEVSAFVTGLFATADPDEAAGDTLTVLAALAQGADRARRDLRDQPAVRAAVLRTIGDVYRDRGQLDLADSLLSEAAATGGLDGPARADALEALGALRLQQGTYDAADSLFYQSLALRLEAFGPDHGDVAAALVALGVLHRYQGDYAGADSLFRRAIATRERIGEADTPEHATALNDLGVALTRQNQLDEARDVLTRSLALRREVHGDTSLAVAETLNNLGTLANKAGRYDEAERRLVQAIDIWRYVLGEDHPNVGIGLSNVGAMYIMVDEYDRARPFYEASLEVFRSRYHDDHPEVAFTLVSMSTLERLQGDADKAEALARQALRSYAVSLAPDHPYVGDAEHTLARALRDRGDASAADHFRRALAIFEEALAPDDSRRYSCAAELAELLAEAGDAVEARRLARAALPHAEAAEDETVVAMARGVLGRR